MISRGMVSVLALALGSRAAQCRLDVRRERQRSHGRRRQPRSPACGCAGPGARSGTAAGTPSPARSAASRGGCSSSARSPAAGSRSAATGPRPTGSSRIKVDTRWVARHSKIRVYAPATTTHDAAASSRKGGLTVTRNYRPRGGKAWRPITGGGVQGQRWSPCGAAARGDHLPGQPEGPPPRRAGRDQEGVPDGDGGHRVHVPLHGQHQGDPAQEGLRGAHQERQHHPRLQHAQEGAVAARPGARDHAGRRRLRRHQDLPDLRGRRGDRQDVPFPSGLRPRPTQPRRDAHPRARPRGGTGPRPRPAPDDVSRPPRGKPRRTRRATSGGWPRSASARAASPASSSAGRSRQADSGAGHGALHAGEFHRLGGESPAGVSRHAGLDRSAEF